MLPTMRPILSATASLPQPSRWHDARPMLCIPSGKVHTARHSGFPHVCESLPRVSRVPVLKKCLIMCARLAFELWSTCVCMSAVLCQGSLSRWALWPSLHCFSPLQSVCSCSTTTPTRSFCATSSPGLRHNCAGTAPSRQVGARIILWGAAHPLHSS